VTEHHAFRRASGTSDARLGRSCGHGVLMELLGQLRGVEVEALDLEPA
jgi:hypothetical protein